MPLNSDFCLDIMGCDQPRKAGCSICNITHEPLNGMNLWDCPEVKKVLAEHRTIGRQEAAAELDRSAGQLPKTYVEKQSLIGALTSMGCGLHESEEKALRAEALVLAAMRREQVDLVNQILKNVVAGTSLKEVEL